MYKSKQWNNQHCKEISSAQEKLSKSEMKTAITSLALGNSPAIDEILKELGDLIVSPSVSD